VSNFKQKDNIFTITTIEQAYNFIVEGRILPEEGSLKFGEEFVLRVKSS